MPNTLYKHQANHGGKNRKAVVIGAGVIGCSITFELQKKGYSVTCIDRNDKVGWGSTANSTAIVRTCYSTLQGVSLAYEGLSYWKDWENYVQCNHKSDIAKYIKCGMTQIMAPDNHWKKVIPIYDKLGIEYKILSVDELRKQFPFLSTASFWPPSLPTDDAFWQESSKEVPGAVYNPGEGYVNDPQLATRNLQESAEKAGAKFLLGRKVTAILRDEHKVHGLILDDDEKIDVNIVVNVTGPHSFIINRMADVDSGMNVSTRPLREEVHCVPAPPGVNIQDLGGPTSDNDNGIYFRPEAGNMILVGGGASGDDMAWIENPDEFNTNVTEKLWKIQVYRLAKRLPNLQVPNETRGVVDLYDVTEDWIPIYDRSDLNGFYMAVGTSGNQFKNAAAVGFMMSTLIDKCENGHDHDNDPIIVKGRYTGLDLDMGFYSRLRAVNTESSLSVLG
ncbi:MAG: FAD-dependent oxidoreductase [Chloroflexi bacterium]|nr:FAD-dependent oxidoreductase [Chloroflexota bacterium]HCU80364.1 FAD-dependent oxidoreductase [Chloroflexota bacterium]